MAVDDQKIWDEKHVSEHGHEGPSSFLRQIFQSHAWRIQPGFASSITARENLPKAEERPIAQDSLARR